MSIVKELPSISFVRGCRNTLSYFTKLIAAYQLGKADTYIEHHSDGTQRHQILMQNSIIQIASEGGYKTGTLSSSILAEDETGEMITEAILRTFKEGRVILDTWRAVTFREFPGRQDLLDLIPKAYQLTLGKLAKGGWIMTDTCNPARRFRRLLSAAITQIALEEGMDKDDIKMFEAGKYCFYFFELIIKCMYLTKIMCLHIKSLLDCWHHLRNVWFGNVITEMGTYLADVLEDDLEQIHFTLRVSTDIGDLLRAIEKYFGITANYAKGKGSMFLDYMKRYHPNAYLYPMSRACGGSRQDIGVEGAVAVLMNIPCYLEFVVWRISCGGGGILENNLYTILRSV